MGRPNVALAAGLSLTASACCCIPLTKAAGGAVLAWPVLGLASSLAFWRARRDL